MAKIILKSFGWGIAAWIMLNVFILFGAGIYYGIAAGVDADASAYFIVILRYVSLFLAVAVAAVVFLTKEKQIKSISAVPVSQPVKQPAYSPGLTFRQRSQQPSFYRPPTPPTSPTPPTPPTGPSSQSPERIIKFDSPVSKPEERSLPAISPAAKQPSEPLKPPASPSEPPAAAFDSAPIFKKEEQSAPQVSGGLKDAAQEKEERDIHSVWPKV